MKYSVKPSGYTLIELLVYIVIVSLLLGSLTAFVGVATSSRAKNQVVSEVNDQGEFAIDYIARQYRSGMSASLPILGGTTNLLSIVLPSAPSTPTSIAVASGVLQVTIGSNTAVSLTNSRVKVTDFTVTNLSRPGTDGAVRISLTLAANSGNTNQGEFNYSQTFVTTAAMR